MTFEMEEISQEDIEIFLEKNGWILPSNKNDVAVKDRETFSIKNAFECEVVNIIRRIVYNTPSKRDIILEIYNITKCSQSINFKVDDVNKLEIYDYFVNSGYLKRYGTMNNTFHVTKEGSVYFFDNI